MKKFTLLSSMILSSFILASTQTPIKVDFFKSDTVQSMSGILHGIYDNWNNFNTTPAADSLITEIHAAFWRIGTAHPFMYETLTGKSEAEVILVVSDIIGYSSVGAVAPYQDSLLFVSKLDALCEETKNRTYIYDIWNEPDIDFFWEGTEEQFFWTFQIAHDRIRKNLGEDILISGPSSAYADTSFFRRFCDFALEKELEINDFSFHGLFPDIKRLEDVLVWVRKEFIEAERYQALNIQRIVVNEIVGPAYQYKPGAILAHFKYLENGKADGACKACWDAHDGSGTNNCWNNTLDGLLTPNQLAPRSAWWAYQAYAELKEIRYPIESQGNTIGLAGPTSDNSIRILLASYAETNEAGPTTLNLTLDKIADLPMLETANFYEISQYQIINTEIESLEQPELLKTDTLNLSELENFSRNLNLAINSIQYLDIKTLSVSTDIDQQLAAKNINLFPNPVSETLFIEMEKTSPLELRFFDLLGNQILQKQINGNTSISTASLIPNTYLIQILDKKTGDISFRKLVKIE